MSESSFSIFGEHITRQAVKNVAHYPLSNIENMGKTINNGPVKPNEPIKKSVDSKQNDKKKSFMSNTGKALQSTPMRQAFTPRAVNVGSLIYTDDDKHESHFNYEELEFNKPKTYDNELEFLDWFIQPTEQPLPPTPPPTSKRYSMECITSYTDEFFTDDFSCDMPEQDNLSFDSILYDSNDSIHE